MSMTTDVWGRRGNRWAALVPPVTMMMMVPVVMVMMLSRWWAIALRALARLHVLQEVFNLTSKTYL